MSSHVPPSVAARELASAGVEAATEAFRAHRRWENVLVFRGMAPGPASDAKVLALLREWMRTADERRTPVRARARFRSRVPLPLQ